MRRALFALIFALSIGFSAAPAFADSAKEPLVMNDISKFMAYQRTVRADIKKGSKYKHVDNQQKMELIEAQDEMFAILEGKRSIDELSNEERLKVFNAQTKVAAVLNDAELDRPVCKREKRLGSNMAQTVCTTKREREKHTADSQQLMRNPRNCAPGVETCG